ncbi:polysaccharide biosynthesis/export family protein [Bowmanella dokdonensis]|uniref:Polysaccharide export protein n=1 Tax=Bowmanella dokdonensis TaxID=751969 RepID=A0A939IQR4_9ALTE|nr:polysaccharide biosynthesis/export family protein [Bowmanella dokdonensis]MBN7824701.1 polysaccharide export protein [Bowmanella dokdonensis]
MVFLLISLLPLSGQAAATQSLSQYQLGSGDVIQITVFGQPDLSVRRRLPDTGAINYPFLGEVKVVGMTAPELEEFIYQGLKGDYLVNPSVSVSIEDYRPFFIDGEVKKPGGYPYQPGLTVDKAAAIAGGYTERAARDEIKIVRSQGSQTRTLEATRTDQVQPGDIITVEQRFF